MIIQGIGNYSHNNNRNTSLKTSCTLSHQSNWGGKMSSFILCMIQTVSRNSVILSSVYHY